MRLELLSLLLGIVDLLLTVALLLCVYYYYSKKRKDDVKEIVKGSLQNENGRLREEVRIILAKEAPASPVTKKDVERMVNEHLGKFDSLLQRSQANPSMEKPVMKETILHRQGPPEPKMLFASAVNEEREAFYEVTDRALNNTIFQLSPKKDDDQKACFTVYEKAFRKVIEEQGYLGGGCEVMNPEMNNTSRVTTIEPGLAVFNKGEWVIKEKAKVKFE